MGAFLSLSALLAGCLIAPSAYAQTGEWVVFDTTNSMIPSNRITGIGIDASDAVWTAHSSGSGIGHGCARFDGSSWTVYNRENSGLPHDNANSFAFSADGTVWIGTGSTHGSGGGLARLDADGWTTYNTDNSALPHSNIGMMSFGPDGGLWMGTYGGIARFDGMSWTCDHAARGGRAACIFFLESFFFDRQGPGVLVASQPCGGARASARTLAS